MISTTTVLFIVAGGSVTLWALLTSPFRKTRRCEICSCPTHDTKRRICEKCAEYVRAQTIQPKLFDSLISWTTANPMQARIEVEAWKKKRLMLGDRRLGQ